jgi:hypothetical protein
MRTCTLPRDESPVFRWLRRATITIVCVHVTVSCWSTYRRIWQVQRIEVIATATTLHPSAVIGYDVITSGEVHNLVRFELVQGARHEILREWLTGRNRVSAYDPRLFHYTRRDTIGLDVISRFRPGPAVLRLTVFGGRKLLRTPAPRVRELQVQIALAESPR